MTTGSTFDTLLALDTALAAHGVPPLSDWWRDQLRSWYVSGARSFAACVGRGGCKSTALYKIALHETLHGDFVVPRGERHWASLTSRLKDEASKGAELISAWLDALGIAHTYTPSAGVLTLHDLPRGMRITPPTVGGNSGWRMYFAGADEVAKWPTEGAVGVDAREVLASARAMMITHRSARNMIVSSPWLDSGPFFDVITKGTTEHRYVVPPTPTWVASPWLTEDDTHAAEENDRVWAREYAGRFSSEWESGFFAGLVDPCVDEDAPHGWEAEDDATYVIAIDPAFSTSDQFAVAVAHHEEAGLVRVDHVEVIKGERGQKLEPTKALERVRAISEEYGNAPVATDQFSFAALAALGRRIDLYLVEEPWSRANKGPMFEFARVLMRDAKVQLPNNPDLRRELAGIATRLLPSGHEQITARPGCRDDLAHATVMAIARASKLAPRVRTPGEGPAHKLIYAPIQRFDGGLYERHVQNLPPTASDIRVTTGDGRTEYFGDMNGGNDWGRWM